MIQKPAFKWLTITLLLSISVFCYTMFVKISTPNTNNNIIASDNQNNQNENPNENPEPNPEPNEPAIVYNNFPRCATEINGATVQNIGGMGRENLSAVHNLGTNTYVIFETLSNSYDIKSNYGTVAIAQLSNDLSIIKMLVLPTISKKTFGTSKITSDGILITTHNKNFTKLYLIGYDLSIKEQLQLEASNNTYMYFTEGGTYLFMSQADKLNAKLISRNLEITNSSTTQLDKASILEVFPTNNGFDIYVNGEDYYGYLKYNKTSGFFGNSFVYNYTIKQIYPSMNNGNLNFGALILGENGYKLIKMDNEMRELASTELGYADVCFMFPINKNYWVYQKSDTAKTMLFCTHLDKVLESTSDLDIISATIYKNFEFELQIFAYNQNHELLILKTTGGMPIILETYNAEQSNVTIDYNGTIYFSSSAKENFYKNNYGNCDIFIIKNSGE